MDRGGIYSAKSMGILGFLLFSIALSSAAVGCWRAIQAWSAGEWSAHGDGHLLWESWAADPGGQRLLQAAVIAVLLWWLSRKISLSWPRRLLEAFAGRRPVALVVVVALAPQIIAPILRPDVADKPKVLLITLDTVRLDYVGWAGFEEFPTTPRLDQLAASGAAFTGTISQSSWTKPATATLLTGLVPNRHLAIGRPASGSNLKLPGRVRTLQEAFASSGWFTAGVSTNPNISSAFGFRQGFMRFGENTTLNAENAIEMAAGFIDRAGSQPWFLYLHLNDAHYPYLPPQEWRGKFGSHEDRPRLTGPTERGFRSGELKWTTDDVDQMRRAWAEEIAYLDETIGAWIEKLLRHHPDLIVVVVSDHGEEFLDHGDIGHGHTLNDELIRVPLQFAWGRDLHFIPGMHNQQLRVMDIAPTLLELCGIEWPKETEPMDGISFASLLTDNAAEDSWSFRPAFSETESPGSPRSGMSGPLRSWRTQEWKWIETDPWSAKSGRGWLYNISGDPNEMLNLSAKLPTRHDQMRRDMRGTGWLEEIVPLLSDRKMDEDTRLELAALGYLDEIDQPAGTMASEAVPWHDCLDF